MNRLELAGAMSVLEKEAVAPAVIAGAGRALMTGMTALGLASAGYDMYSGVREGSLGRTAWGAAQVPLSLAGGGFAALGRVGQALNKVPLLGRSVAATERVGGWLGNKMTSGLAAGAERLGMAPEAQSLRALPSEYKVGLGVSAPYLALLGKRLFQGSPAVPVQQVAQ